MLDEISLREAVESDIDFIFSTWLKSYRTSPEAKRIRTSVYFAYQHPRVEQILLRSKTYLACHKDEPNQIFGYIVYEEPDLLHYCYVKRVFRNLGIGRALIHLAFQRHFSSLNYTHDTYARPYVTKYFEKISYIPFMTPHPVVTVTKVT